LIEGLKSPGHRGLAFGAGPRDFHPDAFSDWQVGSGAAKDLDHPGFARFELTVPYHLLFDDDVIRTPSVQIAVVCSRRFEENADVWQ
jgi:hypothetical protein